MHQVRPYEAILKKTIIYERSEAFTFLKNFFPKLLETKIKAGIFVGLQIKKLFAIDQFSKLLTSTQ